MVCLQTAKKMPLRKCLGCSEMKPKKELIRIVKSALGDISLDFKGKMDGRGAYICEDLNCFEKAKKARRFERAFSSQIPEEIYKSLEEELKNNGK